jgi:3-deoxy-alpha-D-manno-octulosonate 8-oxidase
MFKELDTGVRLVKNVERLTIGHGSKSVVSEVISNRRSGPSDFTAFFIDEFFQKDRSLVSSLGLESADFVEFISTKDEPTTDGIDQLMARLKLFSNQKNLFAIVAVGGGSTLDTAKAVSNLWTNTGKASDYQGWDLVKNPGVFKIALPTISGTGAEATRTCVMTNKETGLKLGMNSDHTVFDMVVLDPALTKTVPRDQYFFTGMDAYIHSMESVEGFYRNAVGHSLCLESLRLCREVFSSEDMQSDDNRELLMVASYLGGMAVATSYVGVVHPFSAGLSVVLGVHHCLANCIVMRSMEQFYRGYYEEFMGMAAMQNILIPEGVCSNLTKSQYDDLYDATMVHEKPLINALGPDFKSILTRKKVIEIFGGL